MDKEREQAHDLDPEELELVNGEQLPERHAMSIIRPDLATMPPVIVDDESLEPPSQT